MSVGGLTRVQHRRRTKREREAREAQLREEVEAGNKAYEEGDDEARTKAYGVEGGDQVAEVEGDQVAGPVRKQRSKKKGWLNQLHQCRRCNDCCALWQLGYHLVLAPCCLLGGIVSLLYLYCCVVGLLDVARFVRDQKLQGPVSACCGMSIVAAFDLELIVVAFEF